MSAVQGQPSAVADRRYSIASRQRHQRKILLVPTCSYSSS